MSWVRAPRWELFFLSIFNLNINKRAFVYSPLRIFYIDASPFITHYVSNRHHQT